MSAPPPASEARPGLAAGFASPLTRRLVLWFLLVGLVPIVFLTVAAYRNTAAVLRREATSRLTAIAERQSHDIRSYVGERERNARILALAPSMSSSLARCRDALAAGGRDGEAYRAVEAEVRPVLDHFEEAAGWEDVFLVTVDGVVAYSSHLHELVGGSVESGVLEKSELGRSVGRALMLVAPDVSDLTMFPPKGRPAAFVAVPLISGGRLLGAAAFELSTREIFSVVNDYTGLGRTGETLITSQVGTDALFLTPVRHDAASAFQRRQPLTQLLGDVDSIRGRLHSGTVTDYRGQQVFAVWSYLPVLRWTMTVKMDAAEAMAPLQRLRWLSAAVELPLVLLVVAAALSIGRSVSRPIVKLTGFTQAVAAGDLAQRITTNRTDELGVLAGAFNQMTEELQRSISELEASRRTLEDRVAARTAEISQKNADLEKAISRLKRAQEQILVQEKMAQLGSLTAGIAHEIKNPLNFVNNFSVLTVDLLVELRQGLEAQKGALPDDAYQDLSAVLGDVESNVAKVLEHGRRADGIVKAMLLHSRGKAGDKQPVDINALVKEYVNLAYHAMRGLDATFNVKFETEYDPEAGSIEAVPQDLSRVILNIVNNACYATNERKKAEGSAYSPVLTIRTRGHQDRVEIRIRDNGPGMPKEVREKIFNPFFTTKPAGAGTGLGLSISHDIVAGQHEGFLGVDSAPGEWTEFRIVLPRKPGVVGRTGIINALDLSGTKAPE